MFANIFPAREENVGPSHLTCRYSNGNNMNSTIRTIRPLLVPLLAVSLTVNGWLVTRATCAMAGEIGQPASDCCQEGNATCVRVACCQAPAPQPQRSQSDQTSRSNNRPVAGQVSWNGVVLPSGDLGQLDRFGDSLRVTASGNTSLITQHIRLQI